MQLYKDGESYGEPIKLSEENEWKYTWESLDNRFSWSVDEVNVADGYEKTIEGSGTNYTIINKWKDKIILDPINQNQSPLLDKSPQTNDIFIGEFWISLFILSGIGLIVIKKKRCQ